jgi:KDO2-lipid IV(A) lauroyltransferase
MPAPKPTLKHRFEFAALYVVFVLGRIVPRRAFVKLGSLLGRLVFDVLGIRREVALTNLRHAFGHEKSEAELVDLARRAYAQLGGSLLEFSSLYDAKPEDLRAWVKIENLETFDRVMAQGRGCVIATAHYGSWELFGAAFAAYGYETTYLVKDQRNPLTAALQNEIRRRGGIDVVKEGPAAAKGTMRALRQGRMVGILPDQDARRHGVFVDFLGRPASTFKGPAFFAYRANVPLIPAFGRRLPNGNHVGVVHEPIDPDPSRPQEEEIQRLTQYYADHLSEWVRRYPENYYWVHRRWKTQPEGAPPFVYPNRTRG